MLAQPGTKIMPLEVLSSSPKICSRIATRCKIGSINPPTMIIPKEALPTTSVMYRRLQSEHLLLQRSFALLRQLVADSCNTYISTSEKSYKWENERKELINKAKELQAKVSHLQETVKEYQEQNELLEFRILEFDHCQLKALQLGDGNIELTSIRLSTTRSDSKKHDLQSSVVTSTSEDEGLGDDARREDSTGPSSLTDFQISETKGLTPEFVDIGDNNCGIFENTTELKIDDQMELQNELLKVSRNLRSAHYQIKELQSILQTKEVQIMQLLTESTPNQSAKTILELEEKLSQSETNREELQEQVLELEEAENDARLESQTLQAFLDNLRYKENELESDLVDANFRLQEYEQRTTDSNSLNEDLRTQICYLQTLVDKYENHIEELEEDRSKLKHQLTILDAKRSEISSTTGTQTFLEASNISRQDRESQTEYETIVDISKDTNYPLKDYGLLENNSECILNLENNFPSILIASEEFKSNVTTRLDCLLTMNSNRVNISSDNLEKCQNEVQTFNESKLKNRLREIEYSNREFEKKLALREKLYRQKEKESKDWKESNVKMTDAIKAIQKEKENIEVMLSRQELERNTLIQSLNDAMLKKEALVNAHKMELDILRQQQITVLEELRDTIKSLKETDTGHIQTINGLETEKKYLLEQLANGRDAHRLPEIRNELAHVKSEQCKVRFEIVEATNQIELMKRFLAEHITTMIEKQKEVELECREQISNLQTAELACNEKLLELKELNYRLEKSLIEKEEELQSVKKSFEIWLQRIEEEHSMIEKELQSRLKEMEQGTTVAVETLEKKRKELEINLQDDLQDLRLKENRYKNRINTLERHVDNIRQEVKNFTPNGLDTTIEISDKLIDCEGLRFAEDTFECLSVEERLEELEKKEAAYLETLENADDIIYQMEVSYRQKIVELETSEKSLQNRICQLEENEQVLKLTLQNERCSADGWKIADLVKEVIDAETRENSLKDQIDELESSQKTLSHKNREIERQNGQLHAELREHDEMSSNFKKCKLKVESIKKEVQSLREIETSLKQSLRQSEEIFCQREKTLLRRVDEVVQENQDISEVVKQLREQVHSLTDRLETAELESVVFERSDTKGGMGENELIGNLKIDFMDSNNETTQQQCLENIVTAGIEARFQLDECYKRAVEAMERDIENPTTFSTVKNLDCINSPSTSGCESDAGSDFNWPLKGDEEKWDCDYNDREPTTFLIHKDNDIINDIPEIGDTFVMSENEREAPRNLKVLRQVGNDSLLVGWCPPISKSSVQSYQIYVGGRLHQHARSPDRTKALLHKLNLNEESNSFLISIQTVSEDGRLSNPTSVTYDPSEPIINKQPRKELHI